MKRASDRVSILLWIGAVVIVGAGGMAVLRAEDILASKGVASVLRFGFASRAPGGERAPFTPGAPQLPAESRCYLRIESEAWRRPLFLAGAGRRGMLEMVFEPGGVERGGYKIAIRGAPLTEFADYQPVAEGATEAFAGAEWLTGRRKWRLTVTNVSDVVLRGADEDVKVFVNRRVTPPPREKPEPSLMLTGRADLTLQSPAGTVTFRKHPVEMVLRYGMAERWGALRLYHTIALTADVQAEGRALGAAKPADGVLRVRIVAGTADWSQGLDARAEDVPDVSETVEHGMGSE